MALQLRTTLPDGVPGPAYQRKIAQLLEDAASDILGGVAPERYAAFVERYKVLHELLRFAEDYVDDQNKQGETIVPE